MRRFPPIIIFTKSKILGAAGSCGTDGIIVITTDFPLWFIVVIFLHEMTHYIRYFLPLSFTWKYRIDTYNENLVEKIKRFLPVIYRRKIPVDTEQYKRYLRWQRTHINR